MFNKKEKKKTVDEIMKTFTGIISSLESVAEEQQDLMFESTEKIREEEAKLELANKEHDKALIFAKNIGELLNE